MIRSPRYLPALLIGATVLLLLATLRILGGEVPEVINSANLWSSSSSKYDAQLETQHKTQHETQHKTQYKAQHETQHETQHDKQHEKEHNNTEQKHNRRPAFIELALESGTNKVTVHNYGLPFRNKPIKIIEIVFYYGVTKYFQRIKLHIVEYDEACGSLWVAKNLEAILFCSDQSSVPFLNHVGSEVTVAGRLVDVIVDNEDHTMFKQMASLREFGEYLLRTWKLASWIPTAAMPPRPTSPRKSFVHYIHELSNDIVADPASITPINAEAAEIAGIACMAQIRVTTYQPREGSALKNLD
ncbi:hard-surface induced protein 5 [Colletotrichum incanum]|uniref:Hard-surface induced protein 5 n=1 Tax=Colletotrichum incanum TaxID=1573173 RepID=A0A167E6V3_COLIC|nr:hard-surface induced protein 5 [Colletotrichum incanum]